MTLFHFANCVVLAYAPYVIAYKYSSLSDYTSIWKCVQAGFVYFFTQFLKLLIVATFFPDTTLAVSLTADIPRDANINEFHLILELVKNSVDMVDVVGLHVAIGAMGATGKGATRALAAGLGWAAAHALATTFVPFAVEARTSGFQWSFVQTALCANLDFIFYVSMATLVWTFQRSDLPSAVRNFVGVSIVLCVLRNVIYQLFVYKLQFFSWSLLSAKAGFVAFIFLSTLFAFSQIGSSNYGGNVATASSHFLTHSSVKQKTN